MQKDFSYPLKIEELQVGESDYKLVPNKEELEVIRKILKIRAVNNFTAEFKLKFYKKQNLLDVSGCVKANLGLVSVVSLDSFDKDYETNFTLHYDTKASYDDLYQDDEDINIDLPDIIINQEIDLADIAIEQLALIMEDYPKKDGEKFEDIIEDMSDTGTHNPFAILSSLKK